jgi:hypothetical protein
VLASIDAHYQSIFDWLDYEYELAARQRDAIRMRDLQQQYQIYENQKTAEVNAENARHQAALAACG